MKNKPLRMLTPERIALLMLGTVLLVWALVVFLKDRRHTDAIPAPVVDTVIIKKTVATTDTAAEKPKKKRVRHVKRSWLEKEKASKSSKSSGSENSQPKSKRSHLDEAFH